MIRKYLWYTLFPEEYPRQLITERCIQKKICELLDAGWSVYEICEKTQGHHDYMRFCILSKWNLCPASKGIYEYDVWITIFPKGTQSRRTISDEIITQYLHSVLDHDSSYVDVLVERSCLTRATIYRHMKRLGIQRPRGRGGYHGVTRYGDEHQRQKYRQSLMSSKYPDLLSLIQKKKREGCSIRSIQLDLKIGTHRYYRILQGDYNEYYTRTNKNITT